MGSCFPTLTPSGWGTRCLCRCWILRADCALRMTAASGECAISEDVARQVLVLDNGGDHLADVFGVDDSYSFAARGGFALDDRQRNGCAVSFRGCSDIDYVAVALGGLGEVGGEEADLVEDTLHDGVQAACADVFCRLVDAEGEAGYLFEGLGGEFELQSLGFEQSRVLLGQRGLWLLQDADEVFYCE